MSSEYKIFFNNRKFIITNSLSDFNNSKNAFFWGDVHHQEFPNLLDFFNSHTYIPEVFVGTNNVEVAFEQFSSNFAPIPAAGGLVKNAEDQVLMIFRNGHWDLPKGKIETGERVEAAALREVGEETGLKGINLGSKICCTYHTYYIGNVRALKETHWYQMGTNGKQNLIPQTEEGITQAVWVDKEKIPTLLKNSYGSIGEVFRLYNL